MWRTLKRLLVQITEKVNSEVRKQSFLQNPVSLFIPLSAYLFSFHIFQLSSGSITDLWLQMQYDEPAVIYQSYRKVNEGFLWITN